MRINYTVTTTSCPNCGKTLKMENTLVYLLFAILLFPLAIIYGIYFWGKASLEGKLAYIPRVGNPFKICSKCGTKVRINDKKLYEELTQSQRYIYQNRVIFQTCYITKAMAIVFGLTSLLIFSKASLDFIVACISIPIAVISFLIFQISKNKCQELTNNAKLKENPTADNTNLDERKYASQGSNEDKSPKTNISKNSFSEMFPDLFSPPYFKELFATISFLKNYEKSEYIELAIFSLYKSRLFLLVMLNDSKLSEEQKKKLVNDYDLFQSISFEQWVKDNFSDLSIDANVLISRFDSYNNAMQNSQLDPLEMIKLTLYWFLQNDVAFECKEPDMTFVKNNEFIETAKQKYFPVYNCLDSLVFEFCKSNMPELVLFFTKNLTNV